MIIIDMEMPKNCQECRMVDEEFAYCHARNEINPWEIWDEQDKETERPSWCPLIEVKK